MNIAKYTNVRRVDFYQPGTIPWSRGGNDYGGCIGSGHRLVHQPDSHAARYDVGATAITDIGTFELTSEQIHATRAAQPHREFRPHRQLLGPLLGQSRRRNSRRARTERSNVIMIGEVQRLNGTDLNGNGTVLDPTEQQTISCDGWAWGGAATLFSTPQPAESPVHVRHAGKRSHRRHLAGRLWPTEAAAPQSEHRSDHVQQSGQHVQRQAGHQLERRIAG